MPLLTASCIIVVILYISSLIIITLYSQIMQNVLHRSCLHNACHDIWSARRIKLHWMPDIASYLQRVCVSFYDTIMYCIIWLYSPTVMSRYFRWTYSYKWHSCVVMFSMQETNANDFTASNPKYTKGHQAICSKSGSTTFCVGGHIAKI